MPKHPAAPAIESLDGQFQVRSVSIRGTKYVLRELTASDYEKILKLAREEKDDPDDTLFRLMLDKSLQEPKIGVDKLYHGPFTVVQRLISLLRDMHFNPADIDEGEDDEETDDENVMGEAQG